MLNNQEQRDFNMLDIINFMSIALQIQNIEQDKIEKDFIHNFVKSVSNEIEKLHKENDIIMDKLDLLLGGNNGINR